MIMSNEIVENINYDKTELHNHGFALTDNPELKTSGDQTEIIIKTVDMATGEQYVFIFIKDHLFIASHNNSMITFRADLPMTDRGLNLLRAIIDGGMPFDYDFVEVLANVISRSRGHEDMLVTPTNGDILMPIELVRNWNADSPVGRNNLKKTRNELLHSMREALKEVERKTGVDFIINDIVYTYATGIMGVLKSHLFPLGMAFAYGPSFKHQKDYLTSTVSDEYDLHLEWLTGQTENANVNNVEFKIGKQLGYRNMANMFITATSPSHQHYDMLKDFKQFYCKVQDDGNQTDTISRAIMGIFMKLDNPIERFKYDYNQTGRYLHSIDHYSTPLDIFYNEKYKSNEWKVDSHNSDVGGK